MAESWEGEHGYAPKNHNHDSKYSKLGHTHDGIGELPAHNHDDRYSLKDHDHDDDYAPRDHDHDDEYAAKDHDHDKRYAPYHDHEDYVTTVTFEKHTESDSHVKDGERDKWNGKVDTSEYNKHILEYDGHDHDEKYVNLNVYNDHELEFIAYKNDYIEHKKEYNDHAHDDKYIKIKDVTAYVIESGNNIEVRSKDNELISRSWYRKWSDGTLEQGGWYWGKEVDGEACTIVNLAVSFVDDVYQVFFTACTDTAVGGSTKYHHNVYLKSTTSFYVQDNMLLGHTGLDWCARGTYKTTATS